MRARAAPDFPPALRDSGRAAALQRLTVMPLLAPPGSTVIARDQRWRVAKVSTFERCSIFTLEAAGRARVRLIDPFDRITVVDADRIVMRQRRAVLQRALAAATGVRPALGLWTAAGATIDLLPYQLEPALGVLRGATRVLLADAVGLGKTIQAGLILSELRERGLVERALVLCPAGVRDNWGSELRQRFSVPCAVLDHLRVAETSAALPQDINPWSTHSTMIASIDFVKRPEVMAALADVPIDIIIADEAHHLTPGTDRGEAVHALAARAPWCVLVSGTPHSGDRAAFDYLSGIGSHGDGLTIFRRSRRDAGFTSSRRERVVRVRSSAAEMALHEAVDAYTRAIWRGKGTTDPSVQLIAITIARRAASSPLALERTLQRRLQLLGEPISQPTQAALPWDEDDDADGCGAPLLLSKPGLDDEVSERSAIARLLDLIARCDRAAKLRWIGRALERLREPAIVFTEYRDTLEALIATLPSRVRAGTICGTTPADQRRAAIESFNAGGIDVLLATDTAGEGLNLHRRCRLVIDVELPWNPLRLEQRLGRVDRLGQQRRVHAIRLLHANTIEARVLDRLQLRRQRAEWLDHAAIDERALAAAVFGTGSIELQRPPMLATDRADRVDDEYARLMRLRSHECATREADTGVAVVAKRRRTQVLVTLHATTFVNHAGAIVASNACGHAAVVDGTRFSTRKAVIAAVRGSGMLQAALQQNRELARKAIERDLRPLRTSVATRLTRIRAQLAATRRLAVQPSLFDGRTDTAIARRNAAVDVLDRALQRRLDSVDAPVDADDAVTRLIAVWPLHRR